MSRRFGRNQKRKMREAHESELALQAMLLRQSQASLASENEGRLKEKRARLALEGDLAEWARRIVALLGPNSAFARELVELGVDRSLFDRVVEHGEPMRGRVDPPLRRMATEPVPFNDAVKLIELFSIHATAENDDLSLRRRYMIRGPHGAAALVMDERTVYHLMRAGDPELARHLMRELIEPWMAGRFEEPRRGRKHEHIDITSHVDRYGLMGRL